MPKDCRPAVSCPPTAASMSDEWAFSISWSTWAVGYQHHAADPDPLQLISVCRQGVVVTLVEQSEQFVIQKLSRGLGVTIPELQMREGMIAPVESSEWEEQGISKSTGQ